MDYFVKCVEYGENLEIDWKNHATYPQKNQASSNFFFFFLLFQYLWKEQIDNFDNQYDVLKAAFCNSRNVFVKRMRDLSTKKIIFFQGCMICLKIFFYIF